MVTTSRFRWVASIGLLLTAFGLLSRQEPVSLVGLSILLWIGIEWFVFRFRVQFARTVLVNPQRVVADVSPGMRSLNIERSYTVNVRAVIPVSLGGLRLWIQDVVPNHFLDPRDSPRLVVDGTAGQAIVIRYRLYPTVVGRIHLPGLQCALTDGRGLFRWQRFVPLPQDFSVLPFLARPQSTVSVLKKNNIQILNGNHRFRRPGFSSELLGIREYQRGDPPRSIAWKASARLGRLMTCEYENEVPIRSTIICDLSDYQFVGRPGPATADRVVSSTASIGRLLLADRDPVGCILVAENDQTSIPHGHGERQLTRILQTLLAYCDRQTVSTDLDIVSLTRAVWVGVYYRFPDLFDDRVNRVRPRFFPLSQTKHALRIQREQLSYVFATLYQEPIGYAERLQFDDREFRVAVKRYLIDFPLRQAGSKRLLDAGAQRESEQASMGQICQGLLEAVARAKDNELFVIFTVAPSDDNELDRLESAIRLTCANHHRVILIEVGKHLPNSALSDMRATRILAETREQNQADRRLRLEQRLARYGAKIAHLKDPKLIETVANEVDLLRSGRGRTIGSSR